MPQRRIIPYNSELKPLARRLRKNMTPAEKRLWQRIRRKQILGYSFYRQRPIDQYIVDFYCPDLLLAIEVDGRSHDGKLEEDLHRQRRLESLGIHILRFSDQEIMHDMENILRAITGWIMEHTQETSP